MLSFYMYHPVAFSQMPPQPPKPKPRAVETRAEVTQQWCSRNQQPALWMKFRLHHRETHLPKRLRITFLVTKELDQPSGLSWSQGTICAKTKAVPDKTRCPVTQEFSASPDWSVCSSSPARPCPVPKEPGAQLGFPREEAANTRFFPECLPLMQVRSGHSFNLLSPLWPSLSLLPPLWDPGPPPLPSGHAGQAQLL